jgi:hypothetical protein
VATHDYVIANGTGAAVRSDLNGALAAIVSNNSSASEPATMYAYQWWADNTTGLLKIRNAANSAWVTIGTLASANLGLLPLAGGTMTGVLAVTAGTAALPGIAVSGDLNNGIYSPGPDQIGISTGGTARITVDSSGNVNIDSNTFYVDAANNRVGLGTSSWSLNSVNTKLGVSLSGTTGDGIGLFSGQSSANAYVAVGSQFGVSNTNNGSQIRFGIDSLGDTFSMIALATANGSTPVERVRIDRLGNVGIGTTGPLRPLTIVGTGYTGIINVSDTSGGTAFGMLSLGAHTTTANDVGIWRGSANQVLGGNALNLGCRDGIIFAVGSADLGSQTERARIDSSGRLLVGTSSASVTCRAVFQGHQADSTAATDVYFQNGTAAASVLSGNALGTLSFAASGSRGAYITTTAEANWTASSFPTNIQFATVASGSTSPTERYRITNDGVMCHDQPTPATYAAAATLTVADLKTGIITYTGTAATLTLPTGTLTEGGFSGIYTNMTFEWSVINTGAGICTIGAGTAHTIVGSGSVAIGASARFTSRRTAANTFVSYRLS